MFIWAILTLVLAEPNITMRITMISTPFNVSNRSKRRMGMEDSTLFYVSFQFQKASHWPLQHTESQHHKRGLKVQAKSFLNQLQGCAELVQNKAPDVHCFRLNFRIQEVDEQKSLNHTQVAFRHTYITIHSPRINGQLQPSEQHNVLHFPFSTCRY